MTNAKNKTLTDILKKYDNVNSKDEILKMFQNLSIRNIKRLFATFDPKFHSYLIKLGENPNEIYNIVKKFKSTFCKDYYYNISHIFEHLSVNTDQYSYTVDKSTGTRLWYRITQKKIVFSTNSNYIEKYHPQIETEIDEIEFNKKFDFTEMICKELDISNEIPIVIYYKYMPQSWKKNTYCCKLFIYYCKKRVKMITTDVSFTLFTALNILNFRFYN